LILRASIGASVLSAAGSLPLQILPFLVLTLIAEARFEIAFAGWVGSVFLVGMLSSSLLLPLLGFSRLTRGHAICSLGAIVLSLAITVSSSSPLLFLVLWFVVGVACGCLQFLGATTAAAATNKKQPFALRLAVALIVASSVIVAVAQFGSQKSYTTLAIFLIGAFVLAARIGLPLYRNAFGNHVSSAVVSTASEQRSWSGLIVVFGFFVGQPGFWAYAMQSASERGLNLKDAAFVIASSKVISALFLLYNAKSSSSGFGVLGLLGLGFAIAIGIVAMTYSEAVMLFFVGVLIWELALNLLSARLQGLVVAASPGHAGVWITGAILLGAAAGPIAHGAAIGLGVGWVFLTYAAIAALLPFFWAWSGSRLA
jgi:hypothetical protein